MLVLRRVSSIVELISICMVGGFYFEVVVWNINRSFMILIDYSSF